MSANGEAVGSPTDIKHNWLYSVVPDYAIRARGIFLVGYCRQCNHSFTVRLENSSTPRKVVIDQLDIPKWGCIPIE